MDDAMLVRILQRVGHFAGDADRVGNRKLALALEPPAQWFAFDERHREPQASVDLTRIENADDVRMLKSRGKLDLALESLGAERCGDFVVQNLERYRAVMPEVVREVDDGETAAPKLALDPVPTSKGSG